MSQSTLVTAGPTIVTSFEELVAFFRERQLPHIADPAAQALESPLSVPPLEGTLYARWEATSPFLQLVFILARHVTPDRQAAIESACCRANAAIALPGFGYDYTRRQVYFRVTLPTIEGVPSLTLDRMIVAVAANSRDFIAAFQQVAGGEPGTSIIALAMASKPPPPHVPTVA